MAVTVDLSGHVAVVTGGGGGIGGGCADTLAAAGAEVFVVDIDDELARGRVEQITQAGGTAHAVVADVRDADQVAGMTATVLDGAGRVDVLVNNVGHYLRPTPLLRSTEDHWAALHDVNVLHVFRCCRAFVPGMVERGSGSVVNVTSVEGLRGYPPDPVYGAYKAAVAHFTRCLALEVGGSGVRVNAIAPDVTQIDPGRLRAAGAARARATIGRSGSPSDVSARPPTTPTSCCSSRPTFRAS